MSEQEKQNDLVRQARQKRVKRLKKIIIIGLVAAILLPIILCVILFVRIGQLEKEVEILQTKKQEQILEGQHYLEENLARTDGSILEVEADCVIVNDSIGEDVAVDDSVVEPEISEEEDNITRVYLTFDDGPSHNTDAILDILKEYNVHASFFVVGKEQADMEPLYKRIVDEGHTIGMHSYSHKYNEIYQSVDAFIADQEKLKDFIFEKTGVVCNLTRFPGGSSNTVSRVPIKDIIQVLNEKNITYFDWNVSSLDASSRTYTADEIVENVTKDILKYKDAVVLFHDANDKNSTVLALPIIIEMLQNMDNVEILPITEDTRKIQHLVLDD